MKARRPLTVALSLLALVAAGCGGSDTLSKKDYESKATAIINQTKSALTGLSTSGSNPATIGPALDKATAALNKAADDLAKLKPPKDVSADNAKIATGLHFIANSFGQLKTAAQKQDKSAFQKYQQTVSTAPEAKAAQAASQDLQKKGYKIGAVGG